MKMLKILGSIVLCLTTLFADVQLNVTDEFTQGDAVSFTIKATGKHITIDPVTMIDGFDVQNGGVSNNIQIYNGVRSEEKVQKYTLFPDRSFTIPPIKITIDGEEFFTPEKHISMVAASKTQSKLYDLSISVDKNEVFVGEEIELTLKFKYAANSKIIDLQFKDPVFENFWSKQFGKSKKYTQNGFYVQELKYLLFAQKSGELTLNPVKLEMAVADMNDPFSFLSGGMNKRLYSNELKINAKALPNGIKLIGDFRIDSKVSTTDIKAGEAVSFDINISGRGNLDDLDDIKLNIPNATIYENKAEKKYDVDSEGEYGGTYTKTFSIVANNDFVIEPIQVQFYDKESQTIQMVQTDRYEIKVESDAKQQIAPSVLEKLPQKVEEKVVTKTVYATTQEKVIYFILGMIVMAIVVSIIWWIKNRQSSNEKTDLPIQKKIKLAQTNDELLKILVAYLGKDEQLDSIIYSLESKNSVELKTLKKESIKIIERIIL